MKLTEELSLERKILRPFNKAIYSYKLIENDDRILIGLSGGADSLCLTDFLAKRACIKQPKFHIEAVHVKIDNFDYESDTNYLEDFCQDRNVKFHVLSAYFTPDEKERRTPCFLCSWSRRKCMFEYAQAEGFNKIALGHHQDDLIATLLMNQLYEGRFDTMLPYMHYRKMPLTIIRPLCMVREAHLKEWAAMHKFKKQIKNCPYEHDSKRTNIQEIVKNMEKLNPEYRYSLWHALEKENKLIEL